VSASTLALQSEVWVRLAAFFAVLGLLSLAERRWALARLPRTRRRVLAMNLLLGVLGAVLVRILSPWLAVDAARWAQGRGIGVLHAAALWPPLSVGLAVASLDFALYLQHRAFHLWPPLWRLHAVHHSDRQLDVSTGLRFHPLELLLSMGWKSLLVCALGAPPGAVVLFETLLSSASLWTHANLRLPARLEVPLGRLLITPRAHRIHHSVRLEQSLRNFGFSVVWWDHLFGTFTPPAPGEATAALGLPGRPRDADAGLWKLLIKPFSIRGL
jgi:sterol desaturase/sphingolipid hydroxylase (fatty acid hydroxylase superfamily)